MIDYGSMTAHELVREYALAYDNGGITCGPEWGSRLKTIESALRTACIKETSVGKAHVIRDSRKGQEAWFYGVSDGQSNVAAGDYVLIPEEPLQKDKKKVPHEL